VSDPGKGGDVILRPGKGAPGGPDGSIIFLAGDGTESLRIDPGGEFYVLGESVRMPDGMEKIRDRLVYTAFKSWLASCHAEMGSNALIKFIKNTPEPRQPWDKPEGPQ
jgi:hypothetical protein